MILASEIITPGQVYWITRLDGLVGLAIGLTVITAIMAAVVLAMYGNACYDAKRSYCSRAESRRSRHLARGRAKLLWCVMIPAAVFFSLIAVLTPSSKDAILIYGIPTVINNDTVQARAKDAVDGTAEMLKLAKDYVAAKLKDDKPANTEGGAVK